MTLPLPPEPEMSARPGRIDFRWPEGIHIALRHLQLHSKGKITAHVVVRSEPPLPLGLLRRGDLNLGALRSKQEMANTLAGVPPGWDWLRVVELVCDRAADYLEEGEPVQRLFADPEGPISPPSYLLSPLLLAGFPNAIYGEGGTMKTILALGLALCSILPWEDNPFNMVPPTKSLTPLYLDWEMDEDSTRYRLQMLLRGHGLPAIEIPYRRCYASLAQDAEHIQDIIQDTGASWLIIDSLAAAAGGDLNASEVALSFHRTLRQIGLTTLLIAHTSKDREGDRGIYGSVFYRNYCRSVWEARKDQEAGSSEASLALVDRKANLSGTRHPLGYRFAFDSGEHRLTVTPSDALTVGGVAERLSLSSRILRLLREENRPLTALSISNLLGLAERQQKQVQPRLSDLRRVGKVVLRADDTWGLSTSIPTPETFR